MTAKEYLDQARQLDKSINRRVEVSHSLREMATSTTSIMRSEVVSHTRNVRRMQDTIAKIVDMEKEINADIDRLVALKKEILGVIGRVADYDTRVENNTRRVLNMQSAQTQNTCAATGWLARNWVWVALVGCAVLYVTRPKTRK